MHSTMAETEARWTVITGSTGAIGPLKTYDMDNLANPEKVDCLMSTYVQTKLAVTSPTAALADDLRPDNILVRAIDPGATQSAETTSGDSAMRWLQSWLLQILRAAAP